MRKTGNCLSCAYLDTHSDETEEITGDDVVGVCRRYPPTPCWDNKAEVAYSCFPSVAMFGWCGEWREA